MVQIFNKSSVVAEMGDRLATIDMGRNRHGPKSGGGAAVLLFVGELGPHLTQCRMGEAYRRTKWHLDPSKPLATIHQRYRQDRHSIGRSIGRTVTSNGRPKEEKGV